MNLHKKIILAALLFIMPQIVLANAKAISAELNKDTKVYFKFNTASMETFGKYEKEWATFNKYIWKGERPKGEEGLGSFIKPVFTLKKGTKVLLDPFYKENGYYTNVRPLDESSGLTPELVNMMKNLNGDPSFKIRDVTLTESFIILEDFSIRFQSKSLQKSFGDEKDIHAAIYDAGLNPVSSNENRSGFHVEVFGIGRSRAQSAVFSKVHIYKSIRFSVHDNRGLDEDRVFHGRQVLRNQVLMMSDEVYSPIFDVEIDSKEFLIWAVGEIKKQLLEQ